LATPLFELTKKDVDFIWDVGCQHAFQVLKATLVDAHVLIWLNFKKPLLTGHPKVLELYCHRRRANLRRWWLTPIKV